jgi:hypothetical protein
MAVIAVFVNNAVQQLRMRFGGKKPSGMQDF